MGTDRSDPCSGRTGPPNGVRDRTRPSHRASAPGLVQGDNDTRCPLQQVLNYAERMTELGKPFELDRFDAGHGALVVAQRIRQMEMLLRFAASHVPGGAEPEA
jgi:hypothetical protein